MSTFCHGVASAQSLDKSGEIVDINGLDITSLPKTGILNYEHKSDVPGQICGKILTAKKIYNEKDCANENERYFWNKTKNPFVYITAELLDDYCQSGKDAAGILKYDHDKKAQNSNAILGFSVEGSEIPGTRVNKMLITRSIARKVTLTASPCNSQCVAEVLVDSPKSQVKDDFDEIFKSDDNAITLFKSGEGEKIYEEFLAKKEQIAEPKDPYSEYEDQGIRAGSAKSGKKGYSHGHTAPYSFNPAEHKTSGEHHRHASLHSDNPKLGDNKSGRAAGHSNAMASGGIQNNRAALSLVDKDKIAQQQGKQVSKKEFCDIHKKESLKMENPINHKKAADHHRRAALAAESKEDVDFHIEQMKAHNKASLQKDDPSPMPMNNAPAPMPAAAANPAPDMNKAQVPGSKYPSKAANPLGKPQATSGGIPKFAPISAPTPAAPKPVVKSEELAKSAPTWSAFKPDSKKTGVHSSHPEYGTVSAVKHPSGTGYQTMHQGKETALNGKKSGIHPTAEAAMSHLKAYTAHVSASKGKTTPQMHDRSSPQLPKMGKSERCEIHKKDKVNEPLFNGVPGKKVRSWNPGIKSGLGQSNMGAKVRNQSNPKSSDESKATSKVMARQIAEKNLKRIQNQPKPNLPKSEKDGDLKKAIEAGSYNAAPGTLVNGAAYQKESFAAPAKKDWKKRAKDDYENWPHREKFEKFMQARMPHLALGEIQAIGRTIALKKTIDFEKSLKNLVKSELDDKSLKDIQKETAEKWAGRAEDAYNRAIDEKSVKWLMDADEYFHEAIEHSSLSEDLATFEKIRAKIMPIRKEALKLLAPGSEA